MAYIPRKSKRKYWEKPDGENKQSWGKTYNPFYNSSVWRKTRKSYIVRNPMCVHCKREGIDKFGTVIDHIIPISKGGEKLNPTNFQTLCESHHNSKSAKEK